MIDGSENAIVSWLLNFRIRMFVKSAVNMFCSTNISFISGLSMIVRVNVVLNRTVVIDSDHTQPTYEITLGFKPFTVIYLSYFSSHHLFFQPVHSLAQPRYTIRF